MKKLVLSISVAAFVLAATASAAPENPCKWIEECAGGICRPVLVCE